MKDSFCEYIPKLSNDIEIYSIDSGKYLIQHKQLGYNIQVASQVVQILHFVDGKRNIERIYEKRKYNFRVT